MKNRDIAKIPLAFKRQGWNKTEEQYNLYYQEQELGTRIVLIAEYDNLFAGYVTVLWESDDNYFRSRNIPEIKDFNVLIKYQNRGIGTLLMEEAEKSVFTVHNTVGLSVGLLSGYGSAQRMYVKRGYIPTGEGLRTLNHIVQYFENIVVDDDLVLSFTKIKK